MSFVGNFIGKSKDEFGKENIREAVTIILFSYAGMFSLFVFGTLRLVKSEIPAAVAIYSVFFVVLLNYIIFKIRKKTKFAAYVIVALVFILMLGIFSVIGKNGTGLYWYYIYPLFAIFLIGNRTGSIFSVILISVTAYFVIFPLDFMITYPKVILIRVVFTYLFVVVLTNIYEYTRVRIQKYSDKMYSEKSEYLEETLQQKEEMSAINEELKKTQEKTQEQAEEQRMLNEKLFAQSLKIETAKEETQRKNQELNQQNEEIQAINEYLDKSQQKILKQSEEYKILNSKLN